MSVLFTFCNFFYLFLKLFFILVLKLLYPVYINKLIIMKKASNVSRFGCSSASEAGKDDDESRRCCA